jgi:hypothetical protein
MLGWLWRCIAFSRAAVSGLGRPEGDDEAHHLCMIEELGGDPNYTEMQRYEVGAKCRAKHLARCHIDDIGPMLMVGYPIAFSGNVTDEETEGDGLNLTILTRLVTPQ